MWGPDAPLAVQIRDQPDIWAILSTKGLPVFGMRVARPHILTPKAGPKTLSNCNLPMAGCDHPDSAAGFLYYQQ